MQRFQSESYRCSTEAFRKGEFSKVISRRVICHSARDPFCADRDIEPKRRQNRDSIGVVRMYVEINGSYLPDLPANPALSKRPWSCAHVQCAFASVCPPSAGPIVRRGRGRWRLSPRHVEVDPSPATRSQRFRSRYSRRGQVHPPRQFRGSGPYSRSCYGRGRSGRRAGCRSPDR